MLYKVNELAKISGVSARTLRYYDGIGLLSPSRSDENEYRLYTASDAERLREILFYRELGFKLEDIGEILDTPGYDRKAAFKNHLVSLKGERNRIDALIKNLEDGIDEMEGKRKMTDKEKFNGFIKEKVEENEKKYGKEIREKYGDKTVDDSNKRVLQMNEDKWNAQERLSNEINETLAKALETGDPAGELAQRACALHKEWICLFWGEEKYSKQAHKGLAEMYVADERFTAYYDKLASGAAEFLKKAIDIYCA